MYEGVNTRDVKNVGTLLEDCRDMVALPSTNWGDVQKTKMKDCWRLSLKFTNDTLFIKETLPKIQRTIVDLYIDKIMKQIRRIDDFDLAYVQEIHLLRNKGPVAEQPPHKDYEVVHEHY